MKKYNIINGFLYHFFTLKILLDNPNLRKYLIIPVIINILVGIVTYICLLNPSLKIFDKLTNQLIINSDKIIDKLPEWLNFIIGIIIFLTFIFKVILAIILLIIIGLIISQFGFLLGIPWYGKLSEKIEILKTGTLELIEINIFQEISRAILFEIKKLILIILFSIPLFFINLIPSIGNFISLIGGIALTITIICLDFCDATLERKRLTFRQKLQFIWGNFPQTVGFGLTSLALISIPLLNLIVIPLCVCAGTILVCENKN